MTKAKTPTTTERPRRAAKASKPDIASAEDYAALEFSGDNGELEKALGEPIDWFKQAKEDYFTLRIVAAMMQKDADEVHRVIAEVGEEHAFNMVRSLDQMEKRYACYSWILKTAGTRAIAGISRFEILGAPAVQS